MDGDFEGRHERAPCVGPEGALIVEEALEGEVDAGTLLDMGCLLAGAGGNRRRLRKSSARMHPYQIFQQP